MHAKGKLVLITGASSGIGAATAKAIARRGAQVILVARDQQRLEAVAADIASYQGQAFTYQAELSEQAAVSALIARIRAERGVPDIVFNNAGAGRWLPVTETSPGEAERMMALPYFAAFNVTRELVPAMLARGSGHIVNITSVASRIVWPGAAAYTAARWAINGFHNALRAELHGSGVRATLAVFGKVSSEYWAHNPGSEQRLPMINRFIPVLTPERAAEAIVRGIETDAREVVRPIGFKVLFLLNALFPRTTEFFMRLGRKST